MFHRTVSGLDEFQGLHCPSEGVQFYRKDTVGAGTVGAVGSESRAELLSYTLSMGFLPVESFSRYVNAPVAPVAPVAPGVLALSLEDRECDRGLRPKREVL